METIKKFVTQTIVSYVQSYFIEIDPETFHLMLGNGHIDLGHLTLDTSHLNTLAFPFAIHSGQIGGGTIMIPWSTIYQDPIRIILADVEICLRSKGVSSTQQQTEKQDGVKKGLRAILQQSVQVKGWRTVWARAQSSIEQTLLRTLWKRLEISISKLAIRFYDEPQLKKYGYQYNFEIMSIRLRSPLDFTSSREAVCKKLKIEEATIVVVDESSGKESICMEKCSLVSMITSLNERGYGSWKAQCDSTPLRINIPTQILTRIIVLKNIVQTYEMNLRLQPFGLTLRTRSVWKKAILRIRWWISYLKLSSVDRKVQEQLDKDNLERIYTSRYQNYLMKNKQSSSFVDMLEKPIDKEFTGSTQLVHLESFMGVPSIATARWRAYSIVSDESSDLSVYSAWFFKKDQSSSEASFNMEAHFNVPEISYTLEFYQNSFHGKAENFVMNWSSSPTTTVLLLQSTCLQSSVMYLKEKVVQIQLNSVEDEKAVTITTSYDNLSEIPTVLTELGALSIELNIPILHKRSASFFRKIKRLSSSFAQPTLHYAYEAVSKIEDFKLQALFPSKAIGIIPTLTMECSGLELKCTNDFSSQCSIESLEISSTYVNDISSHSAIVVAKVPLDMNTFSGKNASMETSVVFSSRLVLCINRHIVHQMHQIQGMLHHVLAEDNNNYVGGGLYMLKMIIPGITIEVTTTQFSCCKMMCNEMEFLHVRQGKDLQLHLKCTTLVIHDTLAQHKYGSSILPILALSPAVHVPMGLELTAKQEGEEGNVELLLGRMQMSFYPETFVMALVAPLQELFFDISPATGSNSRIMTLIKIRCSHWTSTVTQGGNPFFRLDLSEIKSSLNHVNHSVVELDTLVIQRCGLRDLSGGHNVIQSTILAPRDCLCVESCDMLNVSKTSSGYNITAHAIYLTALHRFIQQIVLYIDGPWSTCIKALDVYFPTESKTTKSSAQVNITDIDLYIPRNSSSNDALALSIPSVIISNTECSHTWSFTSEDITVSEEEGSEEDIFSDCVADKSQMCSRSILQMNQVHVYTMVGSSVPASREWTVKGGSVLSDVEAYSHENSDYKSCDALRFAMLSVATVSKNGIQWKRLSTEAFDMQIWHDSFEDVTAPKRTLMKIQSMKWEVEQSQYNLICSCLFDNMYEYATFPVKWTNEYTTSKSSPRPSDMRSSSSTPLRQKIVSEPAGWDKGIEINQLEWIFQHGKDAQRNVLKFNHFVGLFSSGVDVSKILMAASSMTIVEEQKDTTMRGGHMKCIRRSNNNNADACSKRSDDWIEKCLYLSFVNPTCLKMEEFNTHFPVQLTLVCLPSGYNCISFLLHSPEFLLTSSSGISNIMSYCSEYFYDPSFGCPWEDENVQGTESKARSLQLSMLTPTVLLASRDRQVVRQVEFHHSQNAFLWYEWDENNSLMSANSPSMTGTISWPNKDPTLTTRGYRTLFSEMSMHLKSTFSVSKCEYHGSIHLNALVKQDTGVDEPLEGEEKTGGPVETLLHHPIQLFLSVEDVAILVGITAGFQVSSESSQEYIYASYWEITFPRLQFVLIHDLYGISHPQFKIEMIPLHVEYVYERSLDIESEEIRDQSMLSINTALRLDSFCLILHNWQPCVEETRLNLLTSAIGDEGERGIWVHSPDVLQINLCDNLIGPLITLLDRICVNFESLGSTTMMVRECPYDEHCTLNTSVDIHNHTGRPLRFHQPEIENNAIFNDPSISYDIQSGVLVLKHEESGQLFGPARFSAENNGQIVEGLLENFIEMEALFAQRSDSWHISQYKDSVVKSASLLTNSVSLQLFGFSWLHGVSLNTLGTTLMPLLVQHSKKPDALLESLPPYILDILQCSITVDQGIEGRSISLQSVFSLHNDTSYPIHVECAKQGRETDQEEPYSTLVQPDGVVHIPLHVLYWTAIMTNGSALGSLRIRPVLPKTHSAYLHSNAINLLDILTTDKMVVECSADPTTTSSGVSNYFFCVEVQKIPIRSVYPSNTSSTGYKLKVPFRRQLSTNTDLPINTLNRYTLVLRPPLVLENVTATKVVCVIESENGQKICTRSMDVGESLTVYEVNTRDQLKISVSIPSIDCDSLKPIVLNSRQGYGEKVESTLHFSNEIHRKRPQLSFNVETVLGKGGERTVVFYVPYWLLNLTELDLNFQEVNLSKQRSKGSRISDVNMTKTADFKGVEELIGMRLLSDMPDELPDLEAKSCRVHTEGSTCICDDAVCTTFRLAKFATMFCFTSLLGQERTILGDFMRIKTPQCKWSRPISVATVGIDQVLQIKYNGNMKRELGVDVSLGAGKFFRTKLVRFCNRIVFLNEMENAFLLIQNSLPVGIIKRNAVTHLPACSSTKEAELDVFLESQDKHQYVFNIPGRFSPNLVGGTLLKMQRENKIGTDVDDDYESLFRTIVRFCSPTLFVTFLPTNIIPYQIENKLASLDLMVRQQNSPEARWKVIPAGVTVCYTWDDPMLPHNLLVATLDVETKSLTPHVRKSKQNNNALATAMKRRISVSFKPIDRRGFMHTDGNRIPLDMVGFTKFIDRRQDEESLDAIPTVFAKVHTDGPTRILRVSETPVVEHSHVQFQNEHEKISHRLHCIEDFEAKLLQTTTLISQQEVDNLEPIWRGLFLDQPVISCTDQLLVHVLSARGLSNWPNCVRDGSCSPFCEINIDSAPILSDKKRSWRDKQRIKSAQQAARKNTVQVTYCVDGNSNPHWERQCFLFDQLLDDSTDLIITVFSRESLVRVPVRLGQLNLSLSSIDFDSGRIEKQLDSSGSVIFQAYLVRNEEDLRRYWLTVCADRRKKLETQLVWIESRLAQYTAYHDSPQKYRKQTIINNTVIASVRRKTKTQFHRLQKQFSNIKKAQISAHIGTRRRSSGNNSTVTREATPTVQEATPVVNRSEVPITRIMEIKNQVNRSRYRATMAGGELKMTILNTQNMNLTTKKPIGCVIQCQENVHSTELCPPAFRVLWTDNKSTITLNHDHGNIIVYLTTKAKSTSHKFIEAIALIPLKFITVERACPAQWYAFMLPREARSWEHSLEALLSASAFKDLQGQGKPFSTPCIQIAFEFSPNKVKDRTIAQFALVNMKGIALSLFDSKMQFTELLRVSLSTADLQYVDSGERQRLAVQINDVQLDNQQLKAQVNVKTSVYLAQASGRQLFPLVQFFVIKNNTRSHHELTYFEYCSLLVQEMEVALDEKTIRRLYFVLQAWSLEMEEHLARMKSKWSDRLDRSSDITTRWYIDQLDITPLKLTLLFQHLYTSDLRYKAMPYTMDHGHIFHMLVKLIPLVGKTTLELNALQMDNVFQTSTQLRHTIAKHYKTRLLRQLYKLIGRTPLMGNPVRIAENLGNGVHDFFFEPYRAISRGPKAFTKGVAKGTLSFLGNTVFGILDTATRMTERLGEGIASLSVDESYLQHRAAALNHSIEELETTNYRGGKLKRHLEYVNQAVQHSIIGGISGVVLDPLRAARHGDGVKGVVKGFGTGMNGAIIKPTLGVVDLVAHMTKGARDIAGIMLHHRETFPVDCARIPHALGHDRRILVLGHELIWGKMLLDLFVHESSLHVQTYPAKTTLWISPTDLVEYTMALHGPSQDIIVVVLSQNYILACRILQVHKPRLLWKFNRSDLHSIQLQSGSTNGVEVVFRVDEVLPKIKKNNLPSPWENMNDNKILLKSHLPPYAVSFAAEQTQVLKLYEHMIGEHQVQGENPSTIYLLQGYTKKIVDSHAQCISVYCGSTNDWQELEQIPWPLESQGQKKKKRENVPLDGALGRITSVSHSVPENKRIMSRQSTKTRFELKRQASRESDMSNTPNQQIKQCALS